MPEPQGDPVLRTIAYATDLQRFIESLLYLFASCFIIAFVALFPEYVSNGGPPAVIAYLLSLLAIGLLSLFLLIRLRFKGGWHRSAIEVYRNGIRIGRRFVPFHELRKIHTREPKLEQLTTYLIYRLRRWDPDAEYFWRVRRTVSVRLELLDGRRIGFRLKGKAFEHFLRALHDVAGGSSFLPDERPLTLHGVVRLFRSELESAVERARRAAELPEHPPPGRALYSTRCEPTPLQRDIEWLLVGIGVIFTGLGLYAMVDAIRWPGADLTTPLAALLIGIPSLIAGLWIYDSEVWHRKRLEVRADGIKLGGRLLRWDEISEMRYLESIEPRITDSFDSPQLVSGVVTVRVRTLGGETVTFRLKDTEFTFFLEAVAKVTGTRFLPEG
ncbi:MAG: hypothetical protein QXP81_06390 [Nitrososphaerota archaeon]